MISLIQLEYIVAIDKYRHFVTAAEHCFVTQPTLSMQVKKVEDELGVILFDRSKQPLIPTDIGKKIIEQARVVLSENRRIKEIVQEHNNMLSGELVMGVIPSLSPYLLPRFIRLFTTKYKEVKLKVVELLSEQIIEGLKNDSIDVGLLVTPLNEDWIKEEPLFYEEIKILLHKEHALAKNNKINSSLLNSKGLWLLGKGHCFRNQVINICSFQEESNNENNFYFESGSLETIKRIVEIEGGYTLLPELAVGNCNSEQTILKSFIGEPPVREVSLVYARTQHKRRIIEELKQTILEAIPEEMKNKNRGQVVEWR